MHSCSYEIKLVRILMIIMVKKTHQKNRQMNIRGNVHIRRYKYNSVQYMVNVCFQLRTLKGDWKIVRIDLDK